MVEKKEDGLIKSQLMYFEFDGIKFKSKEDLESYKKSPKKSEKEISEEKIVEDAKAEADRVAEEKRIAVAAKAERLRLLESSIMEKRVTEEKAEADGVTEEKAEADGVSKINSEAVRVSQVKAGAVRVTTSMKKPSLIVLSIFAAIVAVLIVIFSMDVSNMCDFITAYCLKTTDLLIVFLIFFVIILILYSLMTRIKGNIDFSNKKTKMNLIESIIWIPIVWFAVPLIIWWFINSLTDSSFGIFYIYIYNPDDNLYDYLLRNIDTAFSTQQELTAKYRLGISRILKWKVSFFILLTIPIWSYWIIKPLNYWIKNLNKVNQIKLNMQKQVCPYCSEKIKLSAIVCKHCGRDIESSN
jgi:hypothetical protein